MRSQRFIAVAGILAAVALTGLLGCSSSDKATNNWITGNPNDPGFQAIQSGINTFIDSTLQYVDNGFSAQSTLITGGGVIDPPSFVPINPDSDVVVTTYDHNTGWHEIYATRTALVYGASWRDSVQFRDDNGAFQQNPSNCAEFSYRHHLGIATHDTTESAVRFDGNSSFEFGGIKTGLGTISGTHDWAFWAKSVTVDSTTWHWLNFNSSLAGLTFTRNGSVWSERPTAGSINTSLEHIYKNGDSAPITTTWTVSVQFGTTTSVTVTQGNTFWTYTHGE